jgi:hypothetical protein
LQLRCLGIGFIIAGVAIVPIGLALLVSLGSSMSQEDSFNAMAGLIVFAGGGSSGGVGLLLFDARVR